MSRLRLCLGVALAASGLLVPLVVGSGTAQAVVVAPSISSVTTLPGHPETLVATVSSDSALTSVTAQLWGYGLDSAWKVWTVPLTRHTSSGTWRSDPIVVTLGSYQAKVSAVDTEGDVGVSRLTTLEYLLQPVVDSATISPAQVDFDHRQVTVTGQMRFYDPRSQVALPAANGKVTLSLSETSTGNQASAPVAADGRFSVSVSPSAYLDGHDLHAWVSYSPGAKTAYLKRDDYDTGTVTTGSVPAPASTGRIVLDHTSVVDVHPARALVTGVLQRRSGTAWVPVAGVHLTAAESGMEYYPAAATTGVDGRFTLRPAVESDGYVNVGIAWNDPLMAFLRNSATSTTARVHVDVHPRTTITWSEREVLFKEIHVRGIVDSSSSHEYVAKKRIYLQESRSGKTGWTTLGSVLTDSAGNFDGYRKIGHASWYHRLVYPGNGSLQRGVTKNYRTGWKDTRIIAFKAKSTTIGRGSKVTLTGRIQVDNGSAWVAPNRRLRYSVSFIPSGEKWDLGYGGGRTRASGRFTFRHMATESGRWFVTYWSQNLHLMTSKSSKIRVTVR